MSEPTDTERECTLRRSFEGGNKMNPFTTLAIVFVVALPTGAYLVTHDHLILGAICIIGPFLMGASNEQTK